MTLSVGIRAEIEAVADELERLGLRRNAGRLRALLGEPSDDERPCPVQDHERQHTKGHVRAIPWGLAEVLYPAYGPGQSLDTIAQRGGFGRKELGLLAVDEYSPRGRLERMPLLTLYEATKAEREGRP